MSTQYQANHFTRIAAIAASAAIANLCGLAEMTMAPMSIPPHVYFMAPEDGDRVQDAFMVRMGAEGFRIESAARGVGPLRGHLHLLVDTPCFAPGQRLDAEGSVIDLSEGETAVALALGPGSHELCVQAGDGAHVALPYAEAIRLDVADSS